MEQHSVRLIETTQERILWGTNLPLSFTKEKPKERQLIIFAMKLKNVNRLLYKKLCLRNASMAELEGFCFVLNLLKHDRIPIVLVQDCLYCGYFTIKDGPFIGKETLNTRACMRACVHVCVCVCVCVCV